MKKIIHLLMISMLTLSTLAYAEKNNFQFQINRYKTQRQGGQTIDVYVRYAVKDNIDYSQYPDYRELRKISKNYLEPSDSLPVNVYWEIIASKIAEELKSTYPSLSGVSVQLLVYPNKKGSISEPGFHGPIYTTGDVTPFNQVILPGKSYNFQDN